MLTSRYNINICSSIIDSYKQYHTCLSIPVTYMVRKKIISLYFVLISNFYHVKYQNQICLKRPLFFICLSFLHIFSQCSIPFSLSPPLKNYAGSGTGCDPIIFKRACYVNMEGLYITWCQQYICAWTWW